MKFNKKVKFFGRSIPAVAIALIAIAALASAGLLSYYGKITGTATVSQSVLVDGKDYKLPITGAWQGSFVAGKTFIERHYLENNADVPATVKFETSCSATASPNSCDEIKAATTVTTTVTELSSYDAYYDNARIMVSKNIGGMTVSDFLALPLVYTVDVTSNPKYAPNIVFWIRSPGGTNTYVVEAWGKDWTGTGLHTVAIQDFFSGTMGYEVTVDTTYGQANRIGTVQPGTYLPSTTAFDEFKTHYGSWTVLSAEVRAQAGAAGGQVIRPVMFKAAGVTIDVPDSDSITGNIILQPGELLNFYIKNSFAINLVPDTYTITTQVQPV
jgi:hypothetical protein